MWELYDRLIGGISPEPVVEDYQVGLTWTLLRAEGNSGVALTVKGRAHVPVYTGPVIGRSLRQIAGCVKSWNFQEASLGMAAINCWYNTPERVNALGGFAGLNLRDESLESNVKKDAFRILASEAAGKKVAVIGRFPRLEEQLAPVCRLSVLERTPERGDYPDSACEYILPEQEMVFITGMTFINKTLPRLLQLTAPGARVILVGPSVPLTPLLREFGVTDLDGFCVTNPEKAREAVRRGNSADLFLGGKMVEIRCKDRIE